MNDIMINIGIVIVFLVIGIYMFTWVYNSPVFMENICRDEKFNYGYDCRVVLDLYSNAHAEIYIDNNWINICDSNIGNYCTMVN